MMKIFASNPARTRGRLKAEPESALRDAFQRDRDRIIHSSAFRRLKHKTQVFVEHEGDLFRTRLTHTIEVAQVARTLAVALGLNEALTEAVALAHDLGHPPFGHTGEDALQKQMLDYGGFDHNAQAIKIVTQLERHYADWDGLNLTWESVEGIAKHNGPLLGDIPYVIADYTKKQGLELDGFASAEAQVAAVSDDIAYNSHDVQDGLRAGLFSLADLRGLPLVGACVAEAESQYPQLDPSRKSFEAVRRFMGVLVEDVYTTTTARIGQINPQSVDDIRGANTHCVRFSAAVWADLQVVRSFLFEHMYRAPSVVEMRSKVTHVIETLFPIYMSNDNLLPSDWQVYIQQNNEDVSRARHIADYISGMTDRFALQEFTRLTGTDIKI